MTIPVLYVELTKRSKEGHCATNSGCPLRGNGIYHLSFEHICRSSILSLVQILSPVVLGYGNV